MAKTAVLIGRGYNAAPQGIVLPHGADLAGFYALDLGAEFGSRNLARRPLVNATVEGAPAFAGGYAAFATYGVDKMITDVAEAAQMTFIAIVRVPAPFEGTRRITSTGNAPDGEGGTSLYVSGAGVLTCGVNIGGAIDTWGTASGFLAAGSWVTLAGVIRTASKEVYNITARTKWTRAISGSREMTTSPFVVGSAYGATPGSPPGAIDINQIAYFSADLSEAQIYANAARMRARASLVGITA